MRIVAVSDLHGYEPKLPEGDVLIVAGDCTARDCRDGWTRFSEWLDKQDFTEKILIGGNHDVALMDGDYDPYALPCRYLEDSWCVIDGIVFWGSPWTPTFNGQNPCARAWGKPRPMLSWDHMPNCDVLITHGPASGVCDETKWGEHVGDVSLMKSIIRVQPRFHVFGHIHECGGQHGFLGSTICFNVSSVDQNYRLRDSIARVFDI